MIDQRLKAIADLLSLRKGGYVCDVGTDHAYLPCYLIKNEIANHCIACDINDKPLNQAKNHIALYGMQNEIETALSDGLKNIDLIITEQITDIAITGMGGELIASILTAVEFTKNPQLRFVLQPMTNAPYLREFLYANGFDIIQEKAVIDRHHYYTVMLVKYTGKSIVTDPLFNLTGKHLEQGNSESIAYVKHEYSKLVKIAEGLSRSKSGSEQLDKLDELCRQIKLKISILIGNNN